ncbi:MAG: hypothetical protein KKB21_05305, partial [Nanoarchaeota archaeon]|nr:hypothetical protein [Nanoarchaeota archaeon]
AWQYCIDANTKKGEQEERCGLEDCFTKKINVDSGFKFDICAPKYAEGFDLSSEAGGRVGASICGLASQKCTVMYKATMTGGCKCVKNCDCLEAGKFTKQMNELCVSLGDCGGYVNINGEYTDSGYSVKKVGKLPQNFIDLYKTFARPVAGQRVEGSDSASVAGKFGFPVSSESGSSGSGGGSSVGLMLGLGAVGIGFAIGQMTVGGFSALTAGAYFGSAPILASGTWAGALAPAFAAFGTVMIGAGIGMIVGGFLAKMLNLSPAGSMLMSAGAAMVGFAATAGLAGQGAFGGSIASAFAAGGPLAGIVPFLWPIAIVGIILIIISLFMGMKKCPPKIVEFKCMPWQPPSGGSDCEKCNANPELKTCSKYRCQSLGQACEFINEGSDDELCITKRNDGRAPVITPLYSVLTANFSYMNVSSAGFSVRESGGRCIEAFSPLVFGINTDKPAQCKIDMQHKPNFDDMEDYFGDSNLYLFNHTMGFAIPSVDLVLACNNDSNLTEADVLSQFRNLKVYTRCQDIFGNMNNNEYLIDVCARPGPDRTAPYISSTSPLNSANIAFNTTSQEVQIYVNEPASCKWSRQDKNYTGMENSFVCEDFCEPAIFGWRCTSTLNNLSLGENTFYFRCNDQPWLDGTVNESKRNANVQGYNYKLRVTETPLIINRILPDGKVTYGSLPGTFDLQVDTSGGVENGKAWCYYRWGTNWILMQSDAVDWDSASNTHFQTGMNTANFNVGQNQLQIKCTDGGNEAYKNSTFNIDLDNSAPIVTRVYNSGGSLYILTNEDSECAYSNSYQTCNFLFENGTQMNGGFTQEHTASWDTQQTYYIKCRDAWMNEPSACSIRVKAYNDIATSFWY